MTGELLSTGGIGQGVEGGERGWFNGRGRSRRSVLGRGWEARGRWGRPGVFCSSRSSAGQPHAAPEPFQLSPWVPSQAFLR